MRNMKFHIIAIAIIALTVFVLFKTMGLLPDEAADVVQQVVREEQKPTKRAIGDHEKLIRISSASFGLNCLDQMDYVIKQYNQNLRSASPEEYETLKANQPKMPTRGNVTEIVKAECHGEKKCSFYIDEDRMKMGRVILCRRALEIIYRCQTLERPRIAQALNRETISFSCEEG